MFEDKMRRILYILLIILLQWKLIDAASGESVYIKKKFGELESRISLQDRVISNLVHKTRRYEDTIKGLQVSLAEQKSTSKGLTVEIKKHEALIGEQEEVCGELSQKLRESSTTKGAQDASPYVKNNYGCVAANVTLSCPEGQHIIVNSADYGEWSQGCTSCCPPHPYDCTELMMDSNANEWLLLKITCDNQSSCVYRFQGSTFVYQCTVNAAVHYVSIYYSCEPEDTNSVVGFTAYAVETRNYTDSQVIIFDGIVSNHGDHYGASSGIFLCPFSGVYYFSLHMFVSGYQLMVGSIIKESSTLVQAYPRDNAAVYDSASTSVITACEPGERIWVAMATASGQLHGGRYSSFSGYLLHRY